MENDPSLSLQFNISTNASFLYKDHPRFHHVYSKKTLIREGATPSCCCCGLTVPVLLSRPDPDFKL